MSDYILTYTRVKFYPLNPVKEDIRIEDIAHSLSLMTRANGHCSHFYSVAQHCVSCYKEAAARGYSRRVQLGCLLHDASESYISDLTRPVKKNMPEYFAIETKLQAVVYDRFGLGDLTESERQQIAAVDDDLLHYEMACLLDHNSCIDPPHLSADHDFSYRDISGVEREFLEAYREVSQ